MNENVHENLLDLKIKAIDDLFCADLIPIFDGCETCNMQPFFERPEYVEVVGHRGPDYKKPYKLEYSSEPIELIDEDGGKYNQKPTEFKHLETVGYMKPPGPVPRDSDESTEKWVEEFRLFDRKLMPHRSGGYGGRAFIHMTHPQSGKSQIKDFDFAMKVFTIIDLKLSESPGLPFSADATMKTHCTCLDRVFELANEISDSAEINNASEVQAPPCIFTGSSIKPFNPASLMCPSAILVIEKRFSEALAEKFGKRFLLPNSPNKDGNITLIASHKARNIKWSFTFQFQNFESSVNSELLEASLRMMEKWLDMDPNTEKGKKDLKVWKFLKYYHNSAPVLLPNGQLVRKQGGMLTNSLLAPYITSIVANLVAAGCLRKDIMLELIEKMWDSCEQREWDSRRIDFPTCPDDFSPERFVDNAEVLGFTVIPGKLDLVHGDPSYLLREEWEPPFACPIKCPIRPNSLFLEWATRFMYTYDIHICAHSTHVYAHSTHSAHSTPNCTHSTPNCTQLYN